MLSMGVWVRQLSCSMNQYFIPAVRASARIGLKSIIPSPRVASCFLGVRSLKCQTSNLPGYFLK
jgi:hypothetical protein